MTDRIADRQRFEELLAFYVTGRLDTADREWMAAYLASHPEAASRLQVEERIRAIVQATASPVPEAVRLQKLLSDFRAMEPRASWLARVARWLASPHLIPAPAIALAAVLFLAQGIALVQLLPGQQAESERYRGAEAPCEEGPQIRIVFKPEAQQAEVVMLLRKVEAAVTAGPDETGQWWIKIPKGRSLEEALGQLKVSSVVDEAILIEPGGKGCPR